MKKDINFLNLVPVPKMDLKYEMTDGKVTVFRENTGFFNWVARKFFHKPRISQIHLDDYGNFIWPLLDGTNDILAISALVKKEFGENAEPLYDRIVLYFKTLSDYGFVEFK